MGGFSLAIDEVPGIDGSLVLIVRGVVDDSTVERFERGLDRAIGTGSGRVVVDLTRCRLFSAGFAALVRVQRRGSAAAATRLVVRDSDLRRMLWILRLTLTLPTYPTVAAALQSFGDGAIAASPRIAGPVRRPARAGPSRGAPATAGPGLPSRARTARGYLLPHPAPSSEAREHGASR